jgi:maltose alpha-D-glucosyltransferase/alpha-amylase
MLQGLVANEGDGWKWTVEELERYYENCAPVAFPEELTGKLLNPTELLESALPDLARDHVGIYLDSAATLGRRTAELHLALALPSDDPAFAPEPLSADDLNSLLADLRQQVLGVFDVLRGNMARLPDEVVDLAALVLSRRRHILDRFQTLAGKSLHAQRTRIHGDYRLGQVLRAKTDYVILDFEGDPARSLADRRFKRCPLQDVAAMLRSFSYAAQTALMNYTARRPEDLTRLEPWARLWEQTTSAEFLRAYRETAQGTEFLPADGGDWRMLLDTYLFEKTLRELLFELNDRPNWVRIPLMGILSLSL